MSDLVARLSKAFSSPKNNNYSKDKLINIFSKHVISSTNSVSSHTRRSSHGFGDKTLALGRRGEILMTYKEILSTFECKNSNDNEIEKLFTSYSQLIQNKSSSTISSLSDGLNELTISLETFVIHMLKLKYEAQWCDAAFRAFALTITNNNDEDNEDNVNSMNKYEYVIARLALDVNDKHIHNTTWIELRRHLVFTYYDRNVKGLWDKRSFIDFLADLSGNNDNRSEDSCHTETRPEAYGIVNKVLISIPDEVVSGEESPDSNTSIIQSFAKCKVDLAITQSDYEQLHLNYITLEKKYCNLKLEMAQLRESLDEQIRSNDNENNIHDDPVYL